MNLSGYKKGTKFLTQDGQTAVLLCRDSKLERPFVFRVGDVVWCRNKNGRHCEKCDGAVYPAILRVLK